MTNKLRIFGLASPLLPLVWLLQVSGCVSDDGDDTGTAGTAGATGATGGSGGSSGGTPGTGGGGTSSGGNPAGGSPSGGSGGGAPAGAVCASPTSIPSATPGIANFDTYDGSDFKAWSFALGGDSATGVFSGSFAYGDRDTGLPETYEMGEGNETTYSMRIADSNAMVYGGGMGLWLSACIDASDLSGVSFWTRGDAPTGTATFTLFMQDTLPIVPDRVDGPIGTCDGTTTTCIHPSFSFPVTDEWTLVEVPWASLTGGNAAGTPVTADGRNITQVQWGIGLNYNMDSSAIPAPYELAVDDVTFY